MKKTVLSFAMICICKLSFAGEPAEDKPAEEHFSPLFFKLGYGTAIELPDNGPLQTAATAAEVGLHLSNRWDLVLSGQGTFGGPGTAEVGRSQSLLSLGARFHVAPVKRKGLAIAWSNFTLHAGVGVGNVATRRYDTWLGGNESNAFQPGVTVGVGWAPLVGDHWQMGISASYNQLLGEGKTKWISVMPTVEIQF